MSFFSKLFWYRPTFRAALKVSRRETIDDEFAAIDRLLDVHIVIVTLITACKTAVIIRGPPRAAQRKPKRAVFAKNDVGVIEESGRLRGSRIVLALDQTPYLLCPDARRNRPFVLEQNSRSFRRNR